MPKKYPNEQPERATRMVLDRLAEYPSPWAAAQALGPKLGVGPETLRKWVVRAQVDQGARPGPSSEELGEIKRLRSEVRDLKEANEMAESTGERTGPVTLRSRQSRDPHRALPGRGFLEELAAGQGVRSAVAPGGQSVVAHRVSGEQVDVLRAAGSAVVGGVDPVLRTVRVRSLDGVVDETCLGLVDGRQVVAVRTLDAEPLVLGALRPEQGEGVRGDPPPALGGGLVHRAPALCLGIPDTPTLDRTSPADQ